MFTEEDRFLIMDNSYRWQCEKEKRSEKPGQERVLHSSSVVILVLL